MTADTKICEDSVHRRNAVQAEETLQVPEVLRNKKHAVVIRQVFRGIGVLVKSDQSARFPQLPEDGTGMPASTERAVDIDTFASDVQCRY